MKKKTFTLLSALFIGLSCFASFSKTGDDKKIINERDQKIYEVTNKDLVSFLNNIPEGFEKQHGFNSRAEFAKATAGPIYTILGMDANGVVKPINMFNVPVVVNGEYRAMITVSFVNGVYEIETVGAALLATELQLLENEQKPNSNQEKIILNVYKKSSSFIGYPSINQNIEDVNLIPLTSAKTALGNSPRVLKVNYKVSEIAQTLIAE